MTASRSFSVLFSMVFMVNLIAGPLSATEGGDRLSGNAVDQVNQVVKGIIAADNAKDLDRVMAYYDDDAILLSPNGGNVEGRDDIRTHYKALFAANDLSITNQIDETVISGDWAISRGVNHVIATSTADQSQSAVSSKYLMTLRRDGTDHWRIVHLIWANQPVGDTGH